MKLNSVTGINAESLSAEKLNKVKNEEGNSFANVLKTSIERVSDMQKQADVKTEALAKGNIDDLHDVMIAGQKASITLETAVQVQRKVIDAYNEVMRMQV